METPEPRERQTPSERLHEVTMTALAGLTSPPEHTVGLTLNAKGDVQIEVTGRGHDLDALAARVSRTFVQLRGRFRAETISGAQVSP